MSKQAKRKKKSARPPKPPLLLSGVLFGAAINILLVSAAQLLLNQLNRGLSFELLATMVAPLIAGTLTSLYVKQRTGLHAVLGGLISIPFLTFVTFGGIWQFGILAGAFCGLAGSIIEILTRVDTKSGNAKRGTRKH